MLEHIHENEDWPSLKTNVGDAKHVPEAILALLSNDEDEVESAYWKIDNYVVLQSDLSESAKYVPKYLEEVLIEAKFKGSALELLFQIGSGASPDKDIENECYQQVMNVLERVQSHTNIIGTQWEETIKEDINDLKELYNEHT